MSAYIAGLGITLSLVGALAYIHYKTERHVRKHGRS